VERSWWRTPSIIEAAVDDGTAGKVAPGMPVLGRGNISRNSNYELRNKEIGELHRK
jgi:hypothetical protein